MTIKTATLRFLEDVFGPERADRIAFAYRDSLSSSALAYRLSPVGRRSRGRLMALRNEYRGRRCFIIGNGPSLARMDLAPLRNEITFGLNRGYLLREQMGAATTFLVAVNRYVIEQFGRELLEASSVKFLSWHSRSFVQDQRAPIFVKWSQGPRFCENVAGQGVWEGATVTYVAMQLAYYMGFQEVILIGVDHSFASLGTPHTLVTSDSADDDHFDPRYFGPGTKWQLPDLETSEVAYALAREHFERAGRRIVDATVGGKLRVFPKVEYAAIPGLA